MNKYILLLLCCFSLTSYGLESDKDAPINIEADKVDIDYAKGIATYTGNVKLTQGSILIEAASIFVITEDKQMKSVEILGQERPALFQQSIDDKQQIRGQAMKIILNHGQDDISFIDNAIIEEDPNKITAPFIRYNSRTHKIIANNQGDNEERIHMTFTPEKALPTSVEPELESE